jgi:hypothetical protein
MFARLTIELKTDCFINLPYSPESKRAFLGKYLQKSIQRRAAPAKACSTESQVREWAQFNQETEINEIRRDSNRANGDMIEKTPDFSKSPHFGHKIRHAPH